MSLLQIQWMFGRQRHVYANVRTISVPGPASRTRHSHGTGLCPGRVWLRLQARFHYVGNVVGFSLIQHWWDHIFLGAKYLNFLGLVLCDRIRIVPRYYFLVFIKRIPSKYLEGTCNLLGEYWQSMTMTATHSMSRWYNERCGKSVY